jgi:hypothetical protein
LTEDTVEKYTETKDLEEVVAAIKAGRRVESSGCVVTIHASLSNALEWEVAHDALHHTIPTLPGRIFRIEVPRPDPGEGWRLLEPAEQILYRDWRYRNGEWLEVLCGGAAQLKEHWYRRRVDPAKPKRRRVALLRSQATGVLCYEKDRMCTLLEHVKAPSEFGFCGYEYAEYGSTHLVPHMIIIYGDGRTTLPVAFWVEEK